MTFSTLFTGERKVDVDRREGRGMYSQGSCLTHLLTQIDREDELHTRPFFPTTSRDKRSDSFSLQRNEKLEGTEGTPEETEGL